MLRDPLIRSPPHSEARGMADTRSYNATLEMGGIGLVTTGDGLTVHLTKNVVRTSNLRYTRDMFRQEPYFG